MSTTIDIDRISGARISAEAGDDGNGNVIPVPAHIRQLLLHEGVRACGDGLRLSAAQWDELSPVSRIAVKTAIGNNAMSDVLPRTEAAAKLGSGQNIVAKVNAHADAIDARADALERDGIGISTSPRGHVNHLRHVASSLRADAAAGRVPHELPGGLY